MKRIYLIFISLFIFSPSLLFAQGEMIPRQARKLPVWLGVRLGADSPKAPGATISQIMRNAPLHKSGIIPGDRIVSFQGEKVLSSSSLQSMVGKYRDGDRILLTYFHNKSLKKTTIILRPKPDPETMVRQHLVGEKAPKLNIILSDGNSKSIASTKGKVTIVDFWATWCGPCRNTDKQLSSLHRKYGSEIEILSVTTESKKQVEKFLKKHKKTGMIVGRDVAAKSDVDWMVSAYPMVVLINQDQKVVSVMFGDGETKLLDARISKLLK